MHYVDLSSPRSLLYRCFYRIFPPLSPILQFVHVWQWQDEHWRSKYHRLYVEHVRRRSVLHSKSLRPHPLHPIRLVCVCRMCSFRLTSFEKRVFWLELPYFPFWNRPVLKVGHVRMEGGRGCLGCLRNLPPRNKPNQQWAFFFGNDVEESIRAQSNDFVFPLCPPAMGFPCLCVLWDGRFPPLLLKNGGWEWLFALEPTFPGRAGGFLFSYDLLSPSCDLSPSLCRRALGGGQAWGRQYAVFLRNFDYLAGKNVWASLCFSLKWG